jgi:hypothetical protein
LISNPVPEADLAAIAGESALASDRYARIEERLAALGPADAEAVLAWPTCGSGSEYTVMVGLTQ